MPQKWQENWPVPGFDHVPDGELNADKIAREFQRQQSINKMGNLTLLTHKLNAKVSNGAFAVKLSAVKAHAALTLNRELHSYEGWNEETINTRGQNLFGTAAKIWSAPMSKEDTRAFGCCRSLFSEPGHLGVNRPQNSIPDLRRSETVP